MSASKELGRVLAVIVVGERRALLAFRRRGVPVDFNADGFEEWAGAVGWTVQIAGQRDEELLRNLSDAYEKYVEYQKQECYLMADEWLTKADRLVKALMMNSVTSSENTGSIQELNKSKQK
ncbi:MAG: hypothetical protein WCV84_04550 [Patescibacteria group bacterium]